MMSANDEFTIRVKVEAPPPLPTKGKKKKAAKKTAQQSQQQKCNLRSSTSISQLCKDVYALFNIPTDHIQSYQMSFLSGFPPKEMKQTGKATVHELGIRPNETITIRFTLADGSNNNIIATNNKASSSTGRQKRASAMAATASFKDVIAAQDAIMKNEKKKVPKRKTTSTTGNISGFGNVAAAASKKSKQPKKVKMEGPGFRLIDGKSFAGSSPSKKNKLRINSVEEIASTQARAEMQSSLHQMQKERLGQERLSAANARINSSISCVFVKVEGGSLVNGGTVLGTAKDDESSSTPDNCLGKTLYTIKYSRGMEGRGYRQDKVNIYEEELVRVALVNLHLELLLHSNGTGDEDEVQRARLTPVMIAQSCPDVFWSLVFLYKKTDLTVNDMLLTILPDFDWDHLNRGGRRRKMSDKARENKRQAKSTTTSDDATQNNGNPEAMAIEDLFQSIDNDWKLVTPVEDDIDELIECIMEGSGEGYDTAKAWARILVDSVQNWRVLANSDSEYIENLLSKNNWVPPTAEIIQGWIDAAQVRALGEIMLEILDGDQDALDVLREAEADNPMDLASFGHEPTLLIQHAKFYKVKWELSKVIKWIVWAEIALDNCEWLQEWTYDNKEHDEGDNVGREKEQRVARLARFN